MKERKCQVIKDEISVSDILSMQRAQQNTIKQNERKGKKTAFQKALSGSKTYLKEQGYLEETEK